MFEHSLAKVLEDPTDNNLPHYDEALIKKNTSLSPVGRNVIHPLLVRKNGATYSERTADGKIIKRVINPNEISLRSTQGGENLLPEKLQDLFALRLADSNALQRLGMQVDQNLEGTVAFTVQSGVPTATFRDNSNRTQAFEANQLATVTYEVCAVSISVKFARTVQVNNLERMSNYVEKMLLSEGGRVLEAACLTGTGASGQPEGIITNAEKSGSTASLVSFPTAGVDVSSLQDMLEDLVGKQAGIEPDQCGWLVGEAIFKTLQSLSDPSGKLPLVSTVMRNGRITREMLGLPLEISSNMPASKILLANFQQAARLLFWKPGLDIIVNPYGGTGQVQVVAQLYCNLALPRPELVVLGS
jgi:HK97 family phage major capsid protein